MSLFTWISSCRLECFQSKSTLLNISPKPKMLCLQAKKRRNNIPEPDQSPQSSNKLCAVGEQRTGTADSTRSKDHVWGNTCVDGHDCLVQIGFMTCYTSALLWMGLSYYSWFCWSLTLETVLTEFFMRVLVTSTSPDRLHWLRVGSLGHLQVAEDGQLVLLFLLTHDSDTGSSQTLTPINN